MPLKVQCSSPETNKQRVNSQISVTATFTFLLLVYFDTNTFVLLSLKCEKHVTLYLGCCTASFTLV